MVLTNPDGHTYIHGSDVTSMPRLPQVDLTKSDKYQLYD